MIDLGDWNDEDLACAGLWRADRFDLDEVRERQETFMRAVGALSKPRKQRRPRQPDICSLVERAEKTGRTVTGITLPDGTAINFGEPRPTDESNPWLADLDNKRARR